MGDGSTSSATDLVTDANLVRFLNVPIYFFSGSENAVYSPESTDLSYTRLREFGDERQYEREVFDGFGHLDCWMSEKAAGVIWPTVKEHMQKVSMFPGSRTVPA
jgi:aspartate/methionine/tyrosine aminotransferase